MIDLSGLSATEIKAMVNAMNKAFMGYSGTLTFLNKLCGVKKTNGRSYTSTPGWAGVSTARNRPDGQAITEKGVHTYKKTIELPALDNSYSFENDKLAHAEPFSDVISEVQAQLIPSWIDSLHMGFVEFIVNNPGLHSILPSSYDCTGYDGEATYSNNHYGGNLDNIAPSTGTSAPDIIKDFWVAFKQLRQGKIPGTTRRYWGSVPMKDVGIVVMFPPALEEVMNNVFGAEQFMSTIGGAFYNSPQSNILADGTMLQKPELIVSDYLTDDSASRWYVFFTSTGISPSPQAIQFVFNPFMSTKGQRGEAIRNGVDLTFGNMDANSEGGGFFKVQYLGEGSDVEVREGRQILASKSYMGLLTANAFRTARIGA